MAYQYKIMMIEEFKINKNFDKDQQILNENYKEKIKKAKQDKTEKPFKMQATLYQTTDEFKNLQEGMLILNDGWRIVSFESWKADQGWSPPKQVYKFLLEREIPNSPYRDK